MDSQALLSFVGVAGLLALTGTLLSMLHQRHKRRARVRQHAQEAARRQQDASQRMGTGRTEAIRGHAERCARRDWEAGSDTSQPLNPFRTGSPQAVLWYASYQSALVDLVEEARAGGRPDCAPYESASTSP